jgi:hypothetical protein
MDWKRSCAVSSPGFLSVMRIRKVMQERRKMHAWMCNDRELSVCFLDLELVSVCLDA